MNTKIYKLIIFDMDGTILNTIEDMKDSVNVTMSRFGFPEHTLEEVKSFVGNGIHKLMERCLPADIDSQILEDAFHYYLEYYGSHNAIKTRPYEGIPELLLKLRQAGHRLAVLSNKADFAVKELAETYFPGLFDLSIGQKDGIPAKPSPEQVYQVLRELGVDATDAIYVGDSEVDIQTANNASLPCISVDWGFRSRMQLVEAGATQIISRPEDLWDLV